MKPSARVAQLIEELLADPSGFADRGRAYQLLQAYFSGAPLETLRPLLRSADAHVRRAAAFVVSELGVKACPVLDDVLSLMNSGDRYLTFHAMESTALCATGERSKEFFHIVGKLEDPDEVLRSLSMFLMSNAAASQLGAALTLAERSRHNAHEEGLRVLIDASASDEAVLTLVHSDQPLRRRYGAVAAARLYELRPQLLKNAEATEDRDVDSFMSSFLNQRGARRQDGV